MKRFLKARTRLLVISADIAVRDKLVTLLTGYGYYVDYVRTRSEGVSSFRKYKQAVVVIDHLLLPRHPEWLISLFRIHKKNPIVLIAAPIGHMEQMVPYLKMGAYDVLHLPLQVDYVEIIFRRLVNYSRLSALKEFIQVLSILLALVAPVWMLCVYLLARNL